MSEKKKLFLIDWGEKCNGARYAIIKSTRGSLSMDIDEIGDPSDIKFQEIDNGDEMLYLELEGIGEESDSSYSVRLNIKDHEIDLKPLYDR